jgi:hypothetical protein
MTTSTFQYFLKGWENPVPGLPFGTEYQSEVTGKLTAHPVIPKMSERTLLSVFFGLEK